MPDRRARNPRSAQPRLRSVPAQPSVQPCPPLPLQVYCCSFAPSSWLASGTSRHLPLPTETTVTAPPLSPPVSRHCWLVPPLQLHCWIRALSLVLRSETSRHMPLASLISVTAPLA